MRGHRLRLGISEIGGRVGECPPVQVLHTKSRMERLSDGGLFAVVYCGQTLKSWEEWDKWQFEFVKL